MITKYTYKEFYAAKALDLLPLQCELCGKKFKIIKRRVQEALRGKGRSTCCFCSKSCAAKSRTKFSEIECSFCHKKFTRKKSQIKKSKNINFFCSKSCSSKHREYSNQDLFICEINFYYDDYFNELSCNNLTLESSS